MIKIGIIGYGYWGPNLLRNFASLEECKVAMVCDSRIERLTSIKKFYPTIETVTNPDDVIYSREIEAVVIATPVSTHFPFAKKVLEANKHVLIEKPMTNSIIEAEELIQLASKKNNVLMVDHTFLYTGAVQKMKELIDDDKIGKIKYFDSTRINLGIIQSDVNVLWDLAPHDISILDYLISDEPYSVQATGVSHIHNEIENIAYLTINFKSDLIAHFNCSWSSPVKIRNILVGGDKKMIAFNDLELTEKLKVYDTAHTVSSDEEKKSVLFDYRIGDVFIPKISTKEALIGMSQDFIDAILRNRKPISNFMSGYNTVRILEASQISIKNKGVEVVL